MIDDEYERQSGAKESNIMHNKFAISVIASLMTVGSALAQQNSTVQMQCHDLASNNNFVGPDETIVNGMACHMAKQAPQAVTSSVPVTVPPAVPQPTVTPTVVGPSAPTAVVNAKFDTATSVNSVSSPAAAPPATTVVSTQANPPAAAVVAPTAQRSNDGKVRLLVTDEPKDESIFISSHRSGWGVNGSSSGQMSGSFVNGTGNINGSSSSNISGGGGSVGGSYGYSQKGADPRTVEVQADLYKSCPSVVVTSDPARADYVMLFRREGGKRSSFFAFGGLTGLALSAASKVDGASVFDVNGDMVFATRARTVSGAIKEVCGHLK